MLRPIAAGLLAIAVLGSTRTPAVAESGVYLPPPGPAVSQSMPGPYRPMRMASQPGVTQQYPYLGASLYPCPKQGIPPQVGGTMIPTEAFAPHEMMYPHEYNAMYAPFYYRVKGKWLWTPFGMESHDKWELLGTRVNVKYRSSYSLFSGFIPPR